MSIRADLLADRIENGANQLIAFAEKLSQAEWQTICPSEERSIGVLIHHVASSYPVEMNLIQVLASGKAIEGVTWDMVDQMNSEHANTQANCSQTETLTLLKENSSLAANAVRSLSDKQLDFAAPISLNRDAPLTTQYFIEEHPISHTYAHLASIRAVINNTP
jgi:hypothetical protein